MEVRAIKYSPEDSDFLNTVSGITCKIAEVNGPFSGHPESHKKQHDLYVAISGKARVKTGKLINLIEEIAEGEYRSDEMLTEQEFTLEAGECLMIPAGVAHILIVDSGKYVQWVYKIDI